MANIYDIAVKAGVSVTTVSKALNNYSDISLKTKKRVQEIADEIGYRPNSAARSLSMKKSWMIGVFFHDHINSGIKHPFFIDVIERFSQVVGMKGYDLLFAVNQLGDKEISYADHCRHRNVDGAIILGTSRNDSFLPELLDSGIPCVAVDLDLIGRRAGYVCSDNIGGSLTAMEYLYNLGHRKIALVTGQMETLAGHERYIGYQRALRDLHLSYRSDYIIHSDFTMDGGYNAMSQLLKTDDPPTAVFASGDMMAVGAIRAVQERGLRVPEDVSIIGFDDIELCQYVTPPLTTIRQNRGELGATAAEALLHLIESKGAAPPVITLPTELMIRGTCAPLLVNHI